MAKYFRAKAVIVREIRATGLKIVFYDRENIYIHDDAHGWYVFHRWFSPRGSYNGGWRQFRHLLLYEKKIDFNHCCRLAFRWDILSQRVNRPPELSKLKIEERFCI